MNGSSTRVCDEGGGLSAVPAGEAVVADDDDFFRLAMASILRARHSFAEVHEVASFEEAAILLVTRPGIVFASFDLDMPGMRDVSQMRALRLAHPGSRLAIVSGSFERDTVLQALAAGIHGYIPKTLGAASLGRAVGLVLAGEIYVPPALAVLSDEACSGRATSVVGAVPEAAGAARLTGRQRQVLDLIGCGSTNREIASRLGLGEGTVKIHVACILKTLGVANRSAAVAAMRAVGPSTKP